MTTILGWIMGDALPWLIGIAGVAGLWIWNGWRAKREGAALERARQMEKAHEANEAMRQADTVDSRDELADRLRDRKF